VRSSFLPFSPPSIGEEEIAEVADTLRSDWITTGPKVKRLEAEFAELVGAEAALAVNSGTAAMHIALAALGIGPGASVITTPMTFASTAHVIEHLQARPLLVDVEPGTLNIDPDRVAAALKRDPSVKALLPVHLYGHPADMPRLTEIAKEARIPIVEDAAHALPARWNGHTVGAQRPDVPLLTAFSFYATKNITTAEGGMLTGPQDIIEEARLWALHGMSRDAYKRYTAEGSWFYEVIRPGFKYNLTDIQAALGLVQLKRLPEFQARRREIVRRYDAGLSDLQEIQLPATKPGFESALHLYVIRLRLDRLTVDRSQFIEALRELNIGTSVHFIPLHLHPYYRDRYGFRPEDFPVAYGEYQRLVTLPLYPRMTDADVDDVIEAVREVAGSNRR
jgi:dTDP-4-amino-4,6-dideoxygalactose transaminase